MRIKQPWLGNFVIYVNLQFIYDIGVENANPTI